MSTLSTFDIGSCDVLLVVIERVLVLSLCCAVLRTSVCAPSNDISCLNCDRILVIFQGLISNQFFVKIKNTFVLLYHLLLEKFDLFPLNIRLKNIY